MARTVGKGKACVTKIKKVDGPNGPWFRASCACGWNEGLFGREDAADQARVKHLNDRK